MLGPFLDPPLGAPVAPFWNPMGPSGSLWALLGLWAFLAIPEGKQRTQNVGSVLGSSAGSASKASPRPRERHGDPKFQRKPEVFDLPLPLLIERDPPLRDPRKHTNTSPAGVQGSKTNENSTPGSLPDLNHIVFVFCFFPRDRNQRPYEPSSYV